jgi:hypothetical protein
VRLVKDPIRTKATSLRYTRSTSDQFIMNIAGFVDRLVMEKG